MGLATGTKSYQGNRTGRCGWITSFLGSSSSPQSQLIIAPGGPGMRLDGPRRSARSGHASHVSRPDLADWHLTKFMMDEQSFEITGMPSSFRIRKARQTESARLVRAAEDTRDQARHDARLEDASARRADEGRWTAAIGWGSRSQALIPPFPNGATRPSAGWALTLR